MKDIEKQIEQLYKACGLKLSNEGNIKTDINIGSMDIVLHANYNFFNGTLNDKASVCSHIDCVEKHNAEQGLF